MWTEAKRLVRRAYFLGEWNMCSYTVRLQFPQLSALSMVCKTCILGTGGTLAKDLSFSAWEKWSPEARKYKDCRGIMHGKEPERGIFKLSTHVSDWPLNYTCVEQIQGEVTKKKRSELGPDLLPKKQNLKVKHS